MRTREWIAGIASILLFVVFIVTEWEGPPRIQRGQNFDERMAAVRSVAILPMDCPSPIIDCALAERELVGFLRTEQRLRVLDSEEVSRLLSEQGLRAADARGKDFEKLGVDVLMVPCVLDYHRDRRYRGRLPGVRLLAGLELIIPGKPPLAKGTNKESGTDTRLAGRSPLGRAFVRMSKAMFKGNSKSGRYAPVRVTKPESHRLTEARHCLRSKLPAVCALGGTLS